MMGERQARLKSLFYIFFLMAAFVLKKKRQHVETELVESLRYKFRMKEHIREAVTKEEHFKYESDALNRTAPWRLASMAHKI